MEGFDITRRMKRLIILFIIICTNLFAQNSFPTENIQTLVKNRVHTYNTYKYQTDLNDSIISSEYLYSITTIRKSKKNTQLNTVVFGQTDRLQIVQQWEDHYNSNFQIIKEWDKTNDYTGLYQYYYDKKGRLIKETDFWIDDNA